MNIASKIIVATVVLSGIGILTSGILVGWQSSSIASSALENRVFEQLVSVREVQKKRIEDYFVSIQNQVITLSSNLMVINATAKFSDAYQRFESQVPASDSSLEHYYTNQFGKVFREKNANKESESLARLNKLDNNSKALQQAYISANTNPLGSKNLLDAASDDSDYSKTHATYHKHFNQILETYGYYDIFIVDVKSGHVIYSVYKELDYATSLISGPYSNSGLAKAFQLSAKSSDKNASFLVDFEPYYPSYNAPAAFISSPIFTDDREK